MPTIETKDYLTCAEAAEALGLTADSVRRYCNNFLEKKSPALEGFQMSPGADWYIHKAEIARYKKERNSRGRPANE